MDEVSPPQQEGRELEERDMMATRSAVMEPLLGRISELLQMLGDNQARRCWKFILDELTGIVASLSQMQMQKHKQMDSSSKPGPDYVNVHFLGMYNELASELAGRIECNIRHTVSGSEQRTSCLKRATTMPHPGDNLPTLLCKVAESPLRYNNLLQDYEGDGNSRTSGSYTADVGGDTFLVGIQTALRNKQLRWFMANRNADNKTDLKVISMFGPAGVGKTALAMEIYRQLQQNEGRNYFQCCATVKVSRKADIKQLLEHILIQIDEQAALESEATAERSLITTLEDGMHKLARDINQCLQGKRYLIVIDDIWKQSDWDFIKVAFPRNSLGSRIVITTQRRSVAQWCCYNSSNGLVYEVKALNKVDSKQLLCRKAFDFEDGYLPEYLKQVCDEILSRCGGIPLFITGMADWLRRQQQVGDRISTEEIPQLPNQFELRLSPTYDDLPFLLKFLLLYMNMFPVGYMFDKDGLIMRWIDDGLFDSDYDLLKPEECFSMLIDTNVITKVATNGQCSMVVEECHWQVNYFMQQFLASKAAEKRMFLTSGTLASEGTEGGKTLRRLSLHQPDPKLALLGQIDLSHTRSLAISGKVDGITLDKFSHLLVLDLEGWQCFKDKDMLPICKMFFLRRLILRNTGVSKLPPEIKKLEHLLTLDISHTQISELPSQICELKELRKLDLRSTQVRQLPKQFWKLQLLDHLLVGGDGVNHYETAIEMLEEIRRLQFSSGRLINIITLPTVDSSKCSPNNVEDIGRVAGLEVLAITWSFHQCTDGRFRQALRLSIEKWASLKSMTIHCGLGCCMDFLNPLPVLPILQKFKVTGGRFTRLPQWFRGLDPLTFIEITVCTLPRDDLAVLGNLPELECLVLGLHFIPEAKIVIDGEGFQKLEILSFTCRVPWLKFSKGAMPSLTYLELKIAGSIASQENVPSGISNLRRLSDVAIRYHPNYRNSPSVKMTVEAVRKGVAEMPINLFINGIEDQEEYVQAVEEEVAARASTSQSEIEEEQ